MNKQEVIAIGVGGKVYCTVHGAEGWHTILAIRPRDGYIKIDGYGAWCPPHNFKVAA